MLKESRTNEEFEYQRLSPEEQKARGILGRLVGVCADFINPTRNGRKYSEKLWQNVFNDPIMKEKIANKCCFGELGHPADRTETDMSKIAISLAEQPIKGQDGKLRAVFDILDTPNGRILKSLCDYGCNIGISSRGEGDLVTDYEGNESVDPDTYSCECWDAVLIPAVKEARLNYVTEALDKTRYKKTLRQSLQESLDRANDDDRKVMEETLENLNITLTESEVLTEADQYDIWVVVRNTDTGDKPRSWSLNNRARAFDYVNERPNEPLEIVYERYINNVFESSQILARRATEFDIDNYRRSPKNIHIYVDGVWMPKGTDPAELKQNIANGAVVLIGFGSKITEALDELELLIINEAFNSGKSLYEAFSLPSSLVLNESNDQMSDDDILDEIAGTLEIKDLEQFKNDVKSGNGQQYIAEVEEKCCDNCKARFKQMLDIENESLDINEEKSTVAVDNNEVIVEELQNQIKAKAELENQIITLQEELSVCYAKESKTEDEIVKYKDTIKRLAEQAKHVQALKTRATKLEEKLTEAKNKETDLRSKLTEAKDRVKFSTEKAVALTESLTTEAEKANKSIESLNESLQEAKANNAKMSKALKEAQAKIKETENSKQNLVESFESEKAKLNENLMQLQKDMNLQKTEYSQKLDKSNKLVEKYKKATAKAVDKYIELQAIRLGSSVNEVKNRLPESYTFDDIDNVCEDLQSYQLNMSKLPFNAISKKSINENIKIKGTSSKNESILPVNGFDDDIDDDLMYLAGK